MEDTNQSRNRGRAGRAHVIGGGAHETDAADLTEQIEKSFTAVYAAVNSGKIQQPGHNVIVYRRLGNGKLKWNVGFRSPARFDDFGQLVYRETPAGRAATTTHYGPYDRLGETHAALVAWARNHGLRLTGTLLGSVRRLER